MSPKNKGNFGKGKKDTSGPDAPPEDEFVSTMGSVGKALEPHAGKIAVAAAVAVAFAAAIAGYSWYNGKQEAEATVIYEKALRLAGVPVVAPLPPDDDGAAEADAAEPDNAAPAVDGPPLDEDGDGMPEEFRSTAQRAEAILAELEKLQARYGSTDVAQGARMLHGTALYDLGRYDDAEAKFQAYAAYAPTAAMRRIAEERRAYAQEARALAAADDSQRAEGLRRALESFKQIQPDDQGPGRDRALYHEGRLLGVLGETDQAIAALEKALEIDPQSAMRYEINTRLVQLQSSK